MLWSAGGFGLAFFILVPGFEWLMHRHTMHTERGLELFYNLFRYHDQIHHKIFDYGRHYTMLESDLRKFPQRLAGLSFDGWFMFGIVGIHAGLYLLALAPLALWIEPTTLGLVFLGLVSGSVAFGFLQIKYHYWYHAQDGFGYRVIAKLPIVGPYFLHLAHHHRKHHKDTSRCLNTLIPTTDYLLDIWRLIRRRGRPPLSRTP